jgi:hypothetical protein
MATNIQETQILVIHGNQMCLNSASDIPRHPVTASYLLQLYNVPYVKCGNKNTKSRIFLTVHVQISAKATNYGLHCEYFISQFFLTNTTGLPCVPNRPLF